MKTAAKYIIPMFVLWACMTTIVFADVPQMINYQGRVTVNGTNFTGTGQFQFALVNGDASQTFWSNGASTVPVPVTKGLYSVLLGDAGMNAIPASVFTNTDVRLRVWFDDGVNGLQLLSPDQRIAAVGYALMSANVPDGLITSNKLADNAVTNSKLATGAVGSSQLSPNLANGIVPWQTTDLTTQTATTNTGYILTNSARSVITLPTAANVGDVVRVTGVGAGGWAVSPDIGQSISGYTAVTTLGDTWTSGAGASEAFYGLATDYDGSTIIGAASYSGRIWISHDYGTTWTARQNVGYWFGAATSSDGMKMAIFGGTSISPRSIYTSSDGGENWTVRETPRNWNGIASSADGTRLVAIASGGQIRTSSDSGVTWTEREQIRNWAGIASSADGMKLAATVTSGQIHTSTDGGITWTARAFGSNWTQIASSADGSKLLAGSSPGFLYTSSDSGVTWTQRGTSDSWAYVASSGDGNRLMANAHATSGRIYLSTDSGVTWNQKENARYWRQVAVSGDGKLVAAVTDRQGGIYLSRTQTSGTTVTGAQGTSATLQHLGNGVWQPLNEALIGAGSIGGTQLQAGAVGSTQLATNAVQTANISAGAVGSTQIANGAVEALQLAKPPRSGTIASSDLIIMFNEAKSNVTFPIPFDTTPMVTLALETENLTIADQSSLVVTNRSATGFAVRWRNSSLPITLDATGDVGWETSLSYIGNTGSQRPAISYRDRVNGDLKFIKAMDPNGATWLTPVSVTTTGNVGAYSSLLWLPNMGVPAITYYDIDNYDLKYVRANNPDGSSWGAPVTLDSLNDVGAYHSAFRLSNNYPAIAYYDANHGDLKFIRANDPSGATWTTPAYVDNNPTVIVSASVSATVVSGNPAILYRNSNNGELLYVRANDAMGAAWPSATTVATGAVASLMVVNDRPAFCYSNGGVLYFQRASDTTGTAWETAIALDTVSIGGPRNLQLAVVGGKPSVSYYANGDLKYAFATDADGTTWNTPVTVDVTGNTGQYNSLAEINGAPAISYFDATSSDLRFVRHVTPSTFTINWIALEP